MNTIRGWVHDANLEDYIAGRPGELLTVWPNRDDISPSIEVEVVVVGPGSVPPAPTGVVLR